MSRKIKDSMSADPSAKNSGYADKLSELTAIPIGRSDILALLSFRSFSSLQSNTDFLLISTTGSTGTAIAKQWDSEIKKKYQ